MSPQDERLLLNHAKTPGFLASRGEEFNLGPETRLDCSELLCNKTLLHKSSEWPSLVSGPGLNSSPLEAKNSSVFAWFSNNFSITFTFYFIGSLNTGRCLFSILEYCKQISMKIYIHNCLYLDLQYSKMEKRYVQTFSCARGSCAFFFSSLQDRTSVV